MVDIEPIAVEGLRDFVRSLRALDSGLPKAVRLAANEAANVVVDEAQHRIPKRSGKAAKSIKAKSTRTAARVSSGGRRAPYAPWLDYGGKVGRNKSVERPFIADGRYVYPSFRANRSKVSDTFRKALARIAAEAGIEVT
ncbi:MAG: HK97 gp10 family phage protein [Chloroflexota bacterium]